MELAPAPAPAPGPRLPIPERYSATIMWDPSGVLKGDRALKLEVVDGELRSAGFHKGTGVFREYPNAPAKLTPLGELSPARRSAMLDVIRAVQGLVAGDVPDHGSAYHGHFAMSVPDNVADVWISGPTTGTRRYSFDLTGRARATQPAALNALGEALQRT